MARFDSEGGRVPTNLFEAAAWHYAVVATCRKCGSVAVFDPHALWWHFERKNWDNNFASVGRRMKCKACKSGAFIGWSHKADATVDMTMPPASEWKRAIDRFRVETMIELNVKYPATQAPPAPSGPGKVIHTYVDVTPHQGEDVHDRYVRASTELERFVLLHDMPRATVTFHELPEGERFFDNEDDRPRDKNGDAIRDYVWVMDAGDLGTIEASDDDGYDVQVGHELIRLTADRFKQISQMTAEEDVALRQRADEQRTTASALAN